MDMDRLVKCAEKLEGLKRLVGEDKLTLLGAYHLTLIIDHPNKYDDDTLRFVLGHPLENVD